MRLAAKNGALSRTSPLWFVWDQKPGVLTFVVLVLIETMGKTMAPVQRKHSKGSSISYLSRHIYVLILFHYKQIGSWAHACIHEIMGLLKVPIFKYMYPVQNRLSPQIAPLHANISKVHKCNLNWNTYVHLTDSNAKAVKNKNSIMNRRTSLAKAVQMMRAWPSFHHFCTASTWMNWTYSSSLIHWIIGLSGLHGNQNEKEFRVGHGNPPGTRNDLSAEGRHIVVVILQNAGVRVDDKTRKSRPFNSCAKNSDDLVNALSEFCM